MLLGCGGGTSPLCWPEALPEWGFCTWVGQWWWGGDFGTGGWCQPKCAGSVLAGTLGSSTAQGQLLAPGPKPIRNGPSSAPKRSAAGRRREGLAPGQEILAFSSSRAAVGSHNARFPRATAKPRRDPGAGWAGEPQGRGTEAECRRAIRKPAPLLVPAAGTSLGRGRQQARHRPTRVMLALAVPAPAPGYLSNSLSLRSAASPCQGRAGLKLERIWALQPQFEYPRCTRMTCSVGLQEPKCTRHCTCASAASSPLPQAHG